MKRQIRFGVFETNSSSMHSLTIVSEEEFERFKKGEMLLTWRDELITKDEALSKIKKDGENVKGLDDDEIEELLRDNEFSTYNNFGGDYEEFEQRHTTKNGDKVVAFGYYGFG